MDERERRVARSIMQLKAEPFCIECGATCLVIMEDLQSDKSSSIWTACTMCGNEILWNATTQHVEMLQRVVALTIQKKGKVVEPYEHIRKEDGTCAGVCGGICSEHWSNDDEDEKRSNIDVDTSDRLSR